VEQNLELSLKQLGVEYIDLYLMHWSVCTYSSKTISLYYDDRPVALNPAGTPPNFPLRPDGTRDLHDYPFTKTWASMEKLLEGGKVRAIGVANFDIRNLEILRQTSKITPAVDQVELHPYLQQRKLKAYCAANGIHVTAYSP
jgi:glycerol 2-dehydrogenase (NADP+)